MVDLQSYFPQIGSSGEKPSDGKDWSPGDNYFAAHLTYLWDQVRKRFGDVEDRLNAIDSDDDGVVDEADYAQDADASTYKGNDIDSDGNGIVNQADDANNLGGNPPSYYATSAKYDDHVSNTTNPHSVSLEQARSQDNTLAGVLDMGVNDLVDDTTTIWDSGNSHVPSSQVQGLDSHTSATNNPHSVTVDQTGGVDKSGDTMEGTLTLSDGSPSASQNWINNNADVPNADYADSAGNADTVDNMEASELKRNESEVVTIAVASNFVGGFIHD